MGLGQSDLTQGPVIIYIPSTPVVPFYVKITWTPPSSSEKAVESALTDGRCHLAWDGGRLAAGGTGMDIGRGLKGALGRGGEAGQRREERPPAGQALR